MRKLASIQRISNIEKIDGADNILCASILGWKVIIRKDDNYKIGDLVVFCEPDSIMPERKEFEFLRDRKFRVKTIKLRGQVSQGICFPISILPNYDRQMKCGYVEGADVTEIIGVKKYDPQAAQEQKEIERRNNVEKNKIKRFFNRYKWYRNLFNKTRRIPFPAFIKKTDEDRIQLYPNICEQEKDTVFEVTEKLDGQSATYFILKNKKLSRLWKPFIYGVCSRNFQLVKEDDSSYWTIFRMLNLKKFLLDYWKKTKSVKDFIIIQGEIIGPKIQNNKYCLSGYDFYMFNFFVDNKNEIQRIVVPKTVPVILRNVKLGRTIQEAVDYAKGESVLHSIPREGIVIRNYEKNLSFKVINPDFLLKYQDEVVE